MWQQGQGFKLKATGRDGQPTWAYLPARRAPVGEAAGGRVRDSR
jgi:hypothetical protein